MLFAKLGLLMTMLIVVDGVGNDVRSRGSGTYTPSKKSQTICRSYPALTKKQMMLCRRHPDIAAEAIEGIQKGISACQNQMRNRRWNCSELQTKNGNPYTHPIMRQSYPETAFAYALTAAGVAFKVTSECSMGLLKACGCDTAFSGSADTFEWGGCSHDIDFGVEFSIDFLDSRERNKDPKSRMNLHNNRAGRLAIAEYVEKKCKCHGMSGSCQLKTCWMQSPDFGAVAKRLYHKYQSSVKVRPGNKNGGNLERSPATRKRRVPPQSEVVYLEQSPHYCEPDDGIGSAGTKGRLCNKTGSGMNSCEVMCCGRGYNEKLERRTHPCNCTFMWCCDVKCQSCETETLIATCK
ncbi:protein Wnt-10a-like [Antedon mediterranea]|uniref:protein Wnt-10a-like n=1 Tax=Antedon mediterranea TaxID=105859 RepID=UPI003AF93AFA